MIKLKNIKTNKGTVELITTDPSSTDMGVRYKKWSIPLFCPENPYIVHEINVKRNSAFATNSDFLISRSLQPNMVDFFLN